jgi:hypothetical protein
LLEILKCAKNTLSYVIQKRKMVVLFQALIFRLKVMIIKLGLTLLQDNGAAGGAL